MQLLRRQGEAQQPRRGFEAAQAGQGDRTGIGRRTLANGQAGGGCHGAIMHAFLACMERV